MGERGGGEGKGDYEITLRKIAYILIRGSFLIPSVLKSGAEGPDFKTYRFWVEAA